ncbi:Gfo/Idh/MocA family protein [Devosia sp. A369]
MRILIVGYGSIGQRHLRNLRAILADVECIVLRRRDERVEGATVVTDLAAALALRPTLAVIAVPSGNHIDYLIDLIGAGVPTYVEKPVVTQLAHVAAVRQALGAHPNALHFTGFNLRLLPSLIKVRTLLQQGSVGTIGRSSFSAGQWLPDWRAAADFKHSYSASRSDGGGVIFDLSHELDAARFLLGEVELTGCTTMRVPSLDIAVESVASMIGTSAAGALVNVNVDYIARRPIRRYEFVGDLGTLVWDLAAKRLELHNQTGVEVLTDDPADFDVSETYLEAMRGFVASAVTGKASSLQSLEDGLDSTALAIRAHELGGA